MAQDVDLVEVYLAAMKAGVIWPKGSVFGKTEIPAFPREIMEAKVEEMMMKLCVPSLTPDARDERI